MVFGVCEQVQKCAVTTFGLLLELGRPVHLANDHVRDGLSLAKDNS